MAKLIKNNFNGNLVRELAALLEETGLSEIEYGEDGMKIRVAKNTTLAATSYPSHTVSSSPPSPVIAESTTSNKVPVDHPGTIKAPMVGVAFTSPEPGAQAFIQVGDKVKNGQTLFLIEAMKVFNPITASQAGKVTHIFITNEMPVEFGEPLAIIE
ncbi:MAG: hypothetical protein CBB68_03670 [Rhodospirillaceae bacterium TMED8]|nr:acetyl-CoA carboxylase biotin carboxyl carrier protein subunit [Magnetovibrio sp.]OUT51981.1 MAG: hypothetical protein CBB68_03670 [Rhodospirillaceae bacterium TMED8]